MLDPEAIEKMKTVLDDGGGQEAHEAPAEDAPESDATEPETDATEPDADPSEPEDVKDTGATEPPAGPDTQEADDGPRNEHRVPYSRFKQVVDARKEFEAKAAQAEQQIAELKARLEAAKAPAPKAQEDQGSDDDWLDSILNGEDESQPADNPLVKSLDARLARFEMAEAQRKLEAEIAQVRSAYPDVPEQTLLNIVATKPETDLLKAAEAINASRAAFEEQVIADYLSKHPQAVAPAVPPRPRSKSTVGSVPDGGTQKARTLAEATAALRKRLAGGF